MVTAICIIYCVLMQSRITHSKAIPRKHVFWELVQTILQAAALTQGTRLTLLAHRRPVQPLRSSY